MILERTRVARRVEHEHLMSLRSGIEQAHSSLHASFRSLEADAAEPWFAREREIGWETWCGTAPTPQGRPSASEAARLRRIIEGAISDIFGVPQADLSKPSRGKAPVALARQVAMYVAHVSCGLSLTQVGQIFARDRTTVAHACAVIEDKRDDPVFDRALELMEWIVPAMVRQRPLSMIVSS